MKTLTQTRLKELLDYDQVTGLFQWSHPPKNHPGLKAYIAGGIGTGYVTIKIDGTKYKAHRLAWLFVHGQWPSGDLDHVNGCPLDNRIINLRIASNPQNQANRRRQRDKDTPKGVKRLRSGRFQARITINKQQYFLGTFDTERDAQDAYMAKARSHYKDFAKAA